MSLEEFRRRGEQNIAVFAWRYYALAVYTHFSWISLMCLLPASY
jgi:hypothetical protein